jgi:hypothetical protein
MSRDLPRKRSGNTSGITYSWPISSSVNALPVYSVLKFSYAFPGHPVSKFVPSDVPVEKLALLGAATDWYVSLSVQFIFL